MVVNHQSNNAMFVMYSPSLLRANLWELRSWFGCIVKQDDVQSQSRVWTHPHLLKTTNISSRLDLSWWWTPNHFTAAMRRKRKQMWPEMMTSFFMPHRQFSCHGLSCVQNITYFVGGQFCDMWESRMCVYVKTGPPTRFYGWGRIQVNHGLLLPSVSLWVSTRYGPAGSDVLGHLPPSGPRRNHLGLPC